MRTLTQVLFFLALLSVRTTAALDAQRHITEFVHRVWGHNSGVPADIPTLVQTNDGYLWVGSLQGLYRFDGIRFQRFETEHGAQLPSQQIRSLFTASDHRLWIGYLTGGVSVLEGSKLKNYNSADGFPEGSVKGFAEDRQGRVWAASSGGLAHFEDGTWHTVGSESGFPGTGAQAILADHRGALWVAGEHRIAVLDPQASKFELADEPYDGQVRGLAESPDGTVWMAETTRAVRPLRRPGQDDTHKGLTRADCQKNFPDTWKTEPVCRRPGELEVRVGSLGILFDRDGSLWITTIGDGLRRAPHPSQLPSQPIAEFGNALEHFTKKEGLSSDIVTAISEDREGNIWVATREGIDQFRNSALAPVTLGPAPQISIAPDFGGYIVALDSQTHISRFHDPNNVSVSKSSYANLLYRDPFGSIWATGLPGACRLVGDKCSTRLEAAGETRSWFQPWRFAMDGNHRLWAYVPKEGLFQFGDRRWNRFTVPPALTSAVPTTQYTDAAGRVWFGFQDGRLLTMTNELLHLYSSKDGMDVGAVQAVDVVGTHVWVGGERGVVLLRDARFTSVVPYDTPAFSSVSGLLEADDGSLWLNESRGVVRVPPSEVSAILQDSSHVTHYDVLGSLDGFSGAPAQTHSPTAVRGTDGRLWFATSTGVAWVNPRRLYRNELPPPVLIQSIVADGRTLSPSVKLALPVGTHNVQIAYAGLSLSVPERVQFRYRLKGLDEDWQSAGTRRTAYYTKLPPGSYDFQVIASNDAGVWNEAGAELPIRINPAWYQTWWFYALCALLVTAALAALYRLRVAQVLAEAHRLLEARLSERERIARELHDTLLQSFHGLLLQLQTAYKLLPAHPDKARQTLESAIDGAAEAVTEGRDTVQGLRAATVAGNDLAAAIKTLGEELSGQGIEQRGPELRVDVTGMPQALRPFVRDEIYRITGEALRNAIRHAGATRIEADLCYEERELRLRVRDDGKGIDPQFLRQEGRAGHYGIHGMRERAKLMGASFEVWTAPDSGTEVELRIPAARAYARSRASHRWWSVRKNAHLEDS